MNEKKDTNEEVLNEEEEYKQDIVDRQMKLLEELQNFVSQAKRYDSDDMIGEDAITSFLLIKLAQLEYVVDTFPQILQDMYTTMAKLSDAIRELKK